MIVIVGVLALGEEALKPEEISAVIVLAVVVVFFLVVVAVPRNFVDCGWLHFVLQNHIYNLQYVEQN